MLHKLFACSNFDNIALYSVVYFSSFTRYLGMKLLDQKYLDPEPEVLLSYDVNMSRTALKASDPQIESLEHPRQQIKTLSPRRCRYTHY